MEEDRGFPPKVVKDFTEEDITGKTKMAQKDLVSFSFVAIMAHGFRGLIYDKNKTQYQINFILVCIYYFINFLRVN